MPARLFTAVSLAALIFSAPAFAAGGGFHWDQGSSRPIVRQEVPAKKQSKRAEKAHVRTTSRQEAVPGVSFSFFRRPSPQDAVSEATREKDALLQQVTAGKKAFVIDEKFAPQKVRFSGYRTGTIVIDTKAKSLYLVESPFSARRYPIAVGKEGLLFTGTATVGDKQEWPRWIPTKEMIKREPHKYAKYADGMDGGPNNPLGARAIYLYQGKRDTYIRIHGTNQPQTIGSASSNGCFRMFNEHVMELYGKVKMGAEVVVL